MQDTEEEKVVNSYESFSIIALFCYSFLSLAFMAAKKNKIINAFIGWLLLMSLWTLGSLCMRGMQRPSVDFWFHVSLLGLFFLPFAFYNFTAKVLEAENFWCRHFCLGLSALCYGINLFTEYFLAPPEVVYAADGSVGFVYHFTWAISICFLIFAVIIIRTIWFLYQYTRKDQAVTRKMTPIYTGMIILFLGHVLLMVPFFKGFPIDIIGGILNALCIFYALYRMRLFKLTLLISRGNCYVIAAGIVLLCVYNGIMPFAKFLDRYFRLSDSQAIMVISMAVLGLTMLIYLIIKRFFDQVFIKEEQRQAESLKEFSSFVSKTLQVDEILSALVETIQKTVQVSKVYVCLKDDNGEYPMVRSSSPLDVRNFRIGKDHPIVSCLKQTSGCLMMRDFKCSTSYRSLWETEKEQLESWKTTCFVALKDEEDLVGIVMLSEKNRHGGFTYDDITFLSSMDSVSSIAIKNSRLYEKAYKEARMDELTGLLNRKCFYETLKKETENCRDVLSLAILNIDDFKLFNQLYGNAQGDQTLKRIADMIRASVGEYGYVARYSGKEFAVILPDYDVYAAKVLVENICEQVKNMHVKSENYSLKRLTLSCGICAIPYTAANMDELIHNADMAVYHVKRSGKNAIMVFSAGILQENQENMGTIQWYHSSAYHEYASTIYALTAAIDTKDHYTFSHSKNVAYYASELARAYGLNQECVDIVKEAGLLHDIGKIGIPEDILNKPGTLTEEEYEIMKGHVESSIGIIRHLPSLDYVIPAVIGHHERYDGRGYPRRIAGEDIPLMARILCIADSFDAIVSKRSYKEPQSVERAVQILEEEAGGQFDPKLVPAFIKLIQSGKMDVKKEDWEVLKE